MKQNLLFNQASALGKRLAMVLTMLLIVGIGQAWGADVVYKTAKFGSSYNSTKVSSYTSSWYSTYDGFRVDIVNANNNNNGWSYIKMGSKNAASTGTITTNAKIDAAITKVSLKIDAITSSNVTSITLKTATSSNGTYTSVGTFSKATGTQTVTLTSPTANLFYKIEVVCTKGSSNGLIQISQVDYYKADAVSCTTAPIVSAASNSNITSTTATVSCSGITSLGSAGCSITSYGFVYGTTANPTISSNTKVQVGTTYTTTSTAFSKELTVLTANTTYYVRPYATNGYGTAYGTQTSFKTLELPKYTVTLKDDNSTLTQSTAGGSVTLPPRDGCDGYTFAGWTSTWTFEQTTWTTIAPTIINAGSYTPTADVNLYPVYTKTETTQGTTTTTDYVLTDLANIKSTDVVVITSKNSSNAYYAMSNNNGTGSAPAATSVSVSSSKLSSAPDDKFKWNISNNSGTLTIYPNGTTAKWLYCTNTNNGVRVGDNTNKTFKIDATSGYLNHSGTSRYIGVYNKSDWRCYTTVHDNIKDQTLAFFVETTTTISTSTTTTSYISVPDCTKETVVTFDLNGGSGTFDDVTLDGTTYVIPETEPTYNGYNFTGWKIQGGDNTVYKYGTTNSTINNITESITLVAQWSAIEYTITYHLNGGSGVENTTYTIESEDITLPTPEKQGLTFVGWYESADFIGDPVTVIKSGSTGNKEFWAKWEKTTPTFAWSAATCTAALEADNTFPTLNNPNTLLVTYTSSNTDVATIDANGDITLVATGTTTITATGAETATHKSATTIYELTVVESNCRWVETEIEDISPEDEVLVTMGDDKIVYALGTEKITNSPKAKGFNVIGNYLEDSNYSGYSWYIIKTNDGYQLQSYTDNSKFLYGVSSYITISDSPTTFSIFKSTENGNECFSYITGSSVYYLMYGYESSQPAWKRATTTNHLTSQTLKFYKRECLDSEHYWVTWDAGEGAWTDGSSKKLKSYEVGATITKPADPTREGYKFTGWNPNPTTMTEGNKTFTAKWTEVYTITFFNNGSEFGTPIEVVTGGTVTLPATDPTSCDANYPHFFGWTETPIDGVSNTQPADLIQEDFTPTRSMNLHAVFVDELPQLGGWELVTSTDGLVAGDTYTISSSSATTSGYVLGSQKNNNRAAISWTSGTPTELTLGGSTGAWTLFDAAYVGDTFTGGYLYAASNSNNYLRTGSDVSDNAKWAISFSTNKATIAAQGSNSRNTIRYNNNDANNLFFSCYDQNAGNIYLFKRALGSNPNGYITSCCTQWTAPTLSANTSIAVGGTTTITHSGTTYGDVTYTSSNTAIATVDANGKVTGVKPGKTTITASWDGVDGVNNYCPAEATIDVIVTGSFTITYDANHASATGTTASTIIAYPDGTGTVATNGFALNGHEFVKWNTKNGTSYNAGDAITLTDDITLYAIWQPNQYDITVNVVGGSITLGTTTITTANTPQTITDVVVHGQSFSFTNATPDAAYSSNYTVTLNSGNANVEDNNLTVSNVQSDLNITITFVAKQTFTITYVIPTGGGTLVAGATTSIYEGGSITMPGIENNSIDPKYSCEELIGWTTQTTYENHQGQMPTPFYAIGSTMSNIIESTTLHAVYSRTGDGPSGTIELTSEDIKLWKQIEFISNNTIAYGKERSLIKDDYTWTTNGFQQGNEWNWIQIKDDDGIYIKLPEVGGDYTEIVLTHTTYSTDRAIHFDSPLTTSIVNQTTIANQTTTNISVPSGYTSGYLRADATYRISGITVAYGSPNIISTSLNCSNDIDEFTITYNTNYGSAIGQIPTGTVVNGACDNSGELIRFEDLPNGEYTICNSLTATQYKLVGWNSQANGNGGLSYEPGDVITMVPQSDITLYAQWVPEVIMLDNQDRTITYQETVGEAITLPAGAFTCDGKYTFVGWTTDNVDSWNQKITKPTLVAELDGNDETLFVPTEPTVVYAVYKLETTANSKAFYLKSNNNYYAQKHNTYVLKGTSDIADATRLYRQQINVESPNNYWLYYLDDEQEKRFVYINTASLGSLFAPSIGDGETTPEDTEGWEFVSVTGGYKLKALGTYGNSVGIVTHYMYTNESGRMRSNTEGSVYTIETATEINYYAYPTCSDEITITFETRGGTLIPNDHPYVLTKKEGDVITLPGCEYAGLDFIGWVNEPIEPTEIIANPEDIYEAEEEYVVGDQNIVLYAYYSQTPESAEYDGNSDGEWKIYAFADGEYHFAVAPNSEEDDMSTVTICDKSTTWTFTNVAENQYHIQDEAGRYVGVRPAIENKNDFRFTDEPVIWTIESKGNDLYRLTCETNTDRVMLYDNGRIRYSSHTQEENPEYFYVTIGGCFNPIYTTDPARLQAVSVYGTVQITSTLGQTVKAMDKLTLVVRHAEPESYIRFSSPNVTFYDESGNVITTALVESQKQQIPLVVAYTPDVADNSIARPAITVTAKTLNQSTGTYVETNYSVNGRISARRLPADFVIAAKTGNSWVALTANITSTGTQAAPLIMVDNIALPTKATITSNTTKYQLLGLQTDKPTIANSRFKNNGAAVHLYSTNVSKVISASTSTDNNKTYINADAAHEGAANSSNCLFYEWQLQTNDLVHYTLVNSNTTNTSNTKLGYSATYAQWGMYQTGDNVIQEVLLLPIEKDITEMDVEVMEWGTNSMVLRFGSEAPATVDITLGATTTKGLPLANLNSGNTSDIYKVEGLSLAGNDCEALLITDATDASKGKLIRKPILVSGDKKGSDYTTAPTRDVCMHSDIVILNSGKLTADEAKSVGSHVDFANIYVYPGGKLVLDGNSLGVKRQVYLRGGYSWLNSTYALPEVYVNDDINFNGSGNMIYDYYIQNSKYYQFCLPYDVQLGKVTDEAGVDDFPVWVKHYNGALRAADPYATSWEWYPSQGGDANAYFKAGIGYIIAAKPRQVGNTANRPLSIIRFSLGNTAFNGTAEIDKSVATIAHGIDGYKAGTVTANNVGWNFIGNPFMAKWQGDIGHKQLTKYPSEENWDGSYQWVDAATKYITVMSPEDGSDYDQYIAANTKLNPFFPFYIQETADGGTGTITFTLTNRMKKAPAEILAAIVREAFVQIEIVDGDNIDQTGLYVSDKYSDDIDFDDLEKMFGTATDKAKAWFVHDSKRMAFESMTENRAAGSIPLGYRAPQEGTYTFTINEEISKLDCIENIYLTDYENGIIDYDLLLSDYKFESQSVLYNDTRFTVRIIMKEKGEGTVTGVDYIGVQDELPIKFIYQDKIFILHNETIYDATGKKVTTINK